MSALVKHGRRKSVARISHKPPTAKAGRFDRFRWQVVAIASVAFVVRLAYIWQIRPSPFFDVLIGDARQYDLWAGRIAAGDWIGRDVFYQAPLYPYFLGTIYALAGRDLLLVRICQAVLGAASCALLALAGRRVYSERVGWVAGLGLAIYAPAIFFDGLLQKSVLDVFFVSLVLWLLSFLVENPERRSRWFSLGLALGGLALTRENALILIVPILLWRLRPSPAPRSPIPAMLAFALGLLLVLSPIAIRNRIVGGEWHLTTSQFGPNFYLGNNPNADGTASPLREGRGTAEYERQDATNLAQVAVGRNLTTGEVSSYWTKEALAFIRSRPVTWLKLEARKTALLWNRAELVDTDSQDSYQEWSWLLRTAAHIGHFGVLVPLALFGVLVRWSDRERLWLFYAMAAVYAASVLMFYVSARYRLPLVPFLMLFAAAGLSSLPDFVRAPSHGRSAITAAAVIAMAVFANWPLWPSGSMRAVTENNLGNALKTDGRFQEAGLHYRRAIEIRPDYAPAYINLGTLLVAQGKPEEAIAAYKRASALAAIDDDLDAKIGNAFLRAGKPADAVEYFQRALSVGRPSAEVYNNLIVALIAADRPDAAIPVFREAIQKDPGNGGLYFRLGTLLLQRDRALEAVTAFRAGLALVPGSAEGHGNLGAALAASGLYARGNCGVRGGLEVEARSRQRAAESGAGAPVKTKNFPEG